MDRTLKGKAWTQLLCWLLLVSRPLQLVSLIIVFVYA